MWNSTATFFVKGGDTGFADRERRLFECLNAAENEKNEREGSSLNPTKEIKYEGMDVEVQSRKRRRAETKQFRGKESIFKNPGDPPRRFKSRDPPNVPDYHRHPQKWIRYSLGDVSSEDMSDQCNTATALAFLRELELRKEGITRENMDCDDPTTVVFKRPVHKNPVPHVPDDVVNYPESTDKGIFKSSKLIMPEYVVGRENKKKRRVQSSLPGSKYDKSKELKLQHLNFEDELDEPELPQPE